MAEQQLCEECDDPADYRIERITDHLTLHACGPHVAATLVRLGKGQMILNGVERC